MALHQGEEGGGGSGGATGGCLASGSTGSSGIGTASSGWSSSLFSSTSLSVGDDEEDGDSATSSSRTADRRHFLPLSSSSSTSSELEASQMNGTAGGPLYEMSTMRDHLPSDQKRTGLSMYYKGRSESFTSLADVSSVQDLAKKTIPYIRRRPKASRSHAAALGVNRLSKTVAKKAPSGRKPAASECQGKRGLYRC